MEVTINKTNLSLVRGDITRQDTDAIVNAANASLMGGGGVDGAIHRAGGPAILDQCKQIVSRQGPLPAGQAVITIGGHLKAKYVIHTVGPIWRGGNQSEPETLVSAYQESLKLAVKHGLRSISFPSISTGAYGFPIKQAANAALGTIIEFLRHDDSLDSVAVVLFDSRTYETYAEALRRLLPDIE